ncbi:MAG TPA: hypothetical protein VFX15_13025 [Actinomycetes bacterium]|nr:hypothetical protein [Actinomycetes bacterium]
MPITDLADMSAPVLSATLLMNPPASQYRQWPPRPKPRVLRPRWRGWLKATVRPFVPVRVRRKVRLVLVASNTVVDQTPDDVRTDAGRRAA